MNFMYVAWGMVSCEQHVNSQHVSHASTQSSSVRAGLHVHVRAGCMRVKVCDEQTSGILPLL